MKKIIILILCGLILLPGKQAAAREAKKAREIISGYSEVFIKILKIAVEELQIRKDAELLAEVIYHENWHTDKDHLAAYYTGAVVLNRVASEEFPNTIREVIYQTKPCKQYAVTEKIGTEKIPQACIDMATKLVRNGAPDVPKNVLYQATFLQGKLWKKVKTDYFCFG